MEIFTSTKTTVIIKITLIFPLTKFFKLRNNELTAKRIEFKCKTAILLYCFHTAGVLHIFVLYNLLGPGISFYRKSKIIVKRKPNYEIDWFHNWPMIILQRLYAFHFTNDDFPMTINQWMFFIHLIHLIKFI